VPVVSFFKKKEGSNLFQVGATGTVEIPNGHCTGTVRALYGHCTGTVENSSRESSPKRRVSLPGFRLGRALQQTTRVAP